MIIPNGGGAKTENRRVLYGVMESVYQLIQKIQYLKKFIPGSIWKKLIFGEMYFYCEGKTYCIVSTKSNTKNKRWFLDI